MVALAEHRGASRRQGVGGEGGPFHGGHGGGSILEKTVPSAAGERSGSHFLLARYVQVLDGIGG